MEIKTYDALMGSAGLVLFIVVLVQFFSAVAIDTTKITDPDAKTAAANSQNSAWVSFSMVIILILVLILKRFTKLLEGNLYSK